MPVELTPYFRDDKGKEIKGVDLRDPRLGFPGREPAVAAAAAAASKDEKQEKVANVVPLPDGAAHPVDIAAVGRKIDAILRAYTLPPRKKDRLAAEKHLKLLRARELGKTEIQAPVSKRHSGKKKAGSSGAATAPTTIPREIIALDDKALREQIELTEKVVSAGNGRLSYALIELWNGHVCVFHKAQDQATEAPEPNIPAAQASKRRGRPKPRKKQIIDLDAEQRAAITWDIYCQIDTFLQEACYRVEVDGKPLQIASTAPNTQAGGQPAKPVAMSEDDRASAVAAPAPASAARPDYKVADAPQPQAAAAEMIPVLRNLKRISILAQGYEYLNKRISRELLELVAADKPEFDLTGSDEINTNIGIFNRGWEGVFRQFTLVAGRPICADATKIPDTIAHLFNKKAELARPVPLNMYNKRVVQNFPRKGPAALKDLPGIWIPKRLFDCFYDDDDLPFAVEVQDGSPRRLDYPDPTKPEAKDSCCYTVVDGKLQTFLYKALSDASGGGGGGMRSDSPDEALYYWNGNRELGLALGLEEDCYCREGDLPQGWQDAETATPKAKTPMRTAVTRGDDDSALMDSEIRYWKKFPNPVVRKSKNEPKATIPVQDRKARDPAASLGLIYTKKRKGAWGEALGPKNVVRIGSQIGKRDSAGAVMEEALRTIGGMDAALLTASGELKHFDLASASGFARRTIEDPLAKAAWASFSRSVTLWDADAGGAAAAPMADDASDDAAAAAGGAGGAVPIELDLTKPRPAAGKAADAQPAAPSPTSMDTSNKPGIAPAPATGGGVSAADAAGAAAKDGDLRMHGVGDGAVPRRQPVPPDATEIARARASLRAEQEWCHLVGHGDGGDEVFENFISGSKHCNTEQLAIETGQRTARRTYSRTDDTAAADPIVLAVKVTAYLFPNSGLRTTRRRFLASEIELLDMLGLLVQASPYYPPDVKATSEEIETLLSKYESYKLSRRGQAQPAAGTAATASAATAAVADPFEALLKKASEADVRLAKNSDETPAATWWRLWRQANGAPAGRSDEKRAAAAAAASISDHSGAAGIAAARANDAGAAGADEKVTFKKRKVDADGTSIATADSNDITPNRVSEDLKERLEAIFALPLPLGNFVRYKVFFNRKKTVGDDNWIKVFDHTFDAQKESFDFFQYKIVETTVRRVIATAAGKEDSYRAEIKAKADGKKQSGAQTKEGSATAAAVANPAGASARPVAGTVAMDSRS